MANIHCEICGGNRLVKQGDRFICSDCGTSYGLEDARNLLQQNNYADNKRMLKEASGVVCPSCGSKLYIKEGYYVCLEKDCDYKYPINNKMDSTGKRTDADKVIRNDIISFSGRCKTSVLGSKDINITNEGIRLGGELFPVQTLTGFQFKSVKTNYAIYLNIWDPNTKLFSVPMGTKYEATFTVNGDYSFELTGDKKFLTFSQEYYMNFIDALWRLCSPYIIRNILDALRNGKAIKIDAYTFIRDEGITFTKINMFSKNEEYFCDWETARKHMVLTNFDGNLRIELDDIKSMGFNFGVSFGFILNDNTNVLEVLLNCAFKSRIKRLSELL